jgi:hypothetical protein
MLKLTFAALTVALVIASFAQVAMAYSDPAQASVILPTSAQSEMTGEEITGGL